MSYAAFAPGNWQASGSAEPARIAQSYLEQFWNQQLPVDPVAIAQAAQIRVFMNPEMGGLAGCYYEDNGVPTIEYNGNDPLVRQRFTIAHEVGHHALRHGPRFRDSTESFSLGNYDPVEAAANKFAAELLMPAAVVNAMIRAHDITNLEQLAAIFNTSSVAMKYRLKNLGWL
ncbi:ImmA/IrrE family metallo-endopeptidase [Burkholderia multivorans]|uniref:ImmA/IrrE family metallo-endopeptidase n=2 Tax=root TaxID=1 RepID=A0A9E7SJ84_9CAUD|nr:ImmA/IrrE family metallo-endopeptidase [Burkholderia multivorans]MBU9358787.1 ImmA/IrrE family metallo-endopeptidase [Burkholderia multivorans]MDN7437033.1 ImmA/IrrE family metallo-endopeptidase [Burkholderia multivorans]USM11602.1 ImmA/IrrE family metallo-endopeptidase [Burkholderia phage Carl1]